MATHEHEDPKVKAIKYIETKKIKILFESLTSKLLQSQPIDPIQFLIDELQTIMAHRAQNKKVCS